MGRDLDDGIGSDASARVTRSLPPPKELAAVDSALKLLKTELQKEFRAAAIAAEGMPKGILIFGGEVVRSGRGVW